MGVVWTPLVYMDLIYKVLIHISDILLPAADLATLANALNSEHLKEKVR